MKKKTTQETEQLPERSQGCILLYENRTEAGLQHGTAKIASLKRLHKDKKNT